MSESNDNSTVPRVRCDVISIRVSTHGFLLERPLLAVIRPISGHVISTESAMVADFLL